MSYNVTQKMIAKALSINSTTSITKYTRNLPYRRSEVVRGRGNGFKLFRLDDVLVALHTHRGRGLSKADTYNLFSVVPVTNNLNIALGDDARERAKRLLAIMTPSENEVYKRVNHRAAQGLSYAFFLKSVHAGDVLKKLPICEAVMRFVLGSDKTGIPVTQSQWGDFAATFTLANVHSSVVQQLAEKPQ